MTGPRTALYNDDTALRECRCGTQRMPGRHLVRAARHFTDRREIGVCRFLALFNQFPKFFFLLFSFYFKIKSTSCMCNEISIFLKRGFWSFLKIFLCIWFRIDLFPRIRPGSDECANTSFSLRFLFLWAQESSIFLKWRFSGNASSHQNTSKMGPASVIIGFRGNPPKFKS